MLEMALIIAILLYLTSLAIAFHKLIFEIQINFIYRALWMALLIAFPLVGILMFYLTINSRQQKPVVRVRPKLNIFFSSFLLALMMMGIIMLVFWIVTK